MPQLPDWIVRSVTPLLPVLLLTACATQPPPTRQAPPPVIPPLPAIARQPAPPEACLPTCSERLLRELQSWPIWQTEPAPPAMRSSSEALLPVIVDAAARVLRREGVDLARAFARARERNDAPGLAEHLEEFLREHRDFVAQSFRAACLTAAELYPGAAAAGEAVATAPARPAAARPSNWPSPTS